MPALSAPSSAHKHTVPAQQSYTLQEQAKYGIYFASFIHISCCSCSRIQNSGIIISIEMWKRGKKIHVRIKIKSNSGMGIHEGTCKSHVVSSFPSHEPKNNKPSSGTNQTHTHTISLLTSSFKFAMHVLPMGKQVHKKQILPLICPSTLKT